MADRFYGMNRGDFDGETDNVQIGSTSNATDVEVRVTTSAAHPTKEDVVKILEIIGKYVALIDTNLPVY